MQIRNATRADVPAIVSMLADDVLGATRESPSDLTPYLSAFDAISADPNQLLMVADRDGVVAGTMQVSLITGLSRRGASRAQIEGVRVASSERGTGLGGQMIQWAIDEARARGCVIVQLTTDKSRADAHRFYEKFGFAATHEGYKLAL